MNKTVNNIVTIKLSRFEVIVLGVVFNENKEVVTASFLFHKNDRQKPWSEIAKLSVTNLYERMGHYNGAAVFSKKSLLVEKLSFQLCEEVSRKTLKNGHIIVTVQNRVLAENTIFSDNSDQIDLSEIENMIRELPIPLHENFSLNGREDLISEFTEELSVVKTAKLFPVKKAIYVKSNSPEISERIIEINGEKYGEEDFKREFNFIPRIKALLYMISPRNLEKGTWGAFLKSFGGPEEFKKLPFTEQKAFVYLYEVFKGEAVKMKSVIEERYIQPSFLPLKDLAVQQVKEPLPEAIIKKVPELFGSKELKGMEFSLLSNLMDKSFKKRIEKNPKVSITKLIDIIAEVSYQGVNTYAKGLAIEASRLGLSERSFRKYEKAYLDALKKLSTSPRSYPTVRGTVNKDYTWEALDMHAPIAWFVGIETHCCQHLDSVGGACVLYAANNPEISGIFRVMKKGKTVAQSFFWFSKTTGDFVFDNIEVLGGELRGSIIDAYMGYVEELRKRKDLFGIRRVTFGTGYTDINYQDFPKVQNPTKLNQLPNGIGVYTDANNQRLLADFTYTENRTAEVVSAE